MTQIKEIIGILDSFNEISVSVRLVLAVICGGLIGLERESKRRAAGFRTHILIAMGGAMTTLLGQYLFTFSESDPLRIGAQVISGIGFIGAGAIIVTRRKEAKGLTTAAGLWTTAIIGLASGAGCYIEVIISTVMILTAELIFSKLEYYLVSSSKVINVYIDIADKSEFHLISEKLREKNIKILATEISKNESGDGISAIFTLKFLAKHAQDEIISEIADIESVRCAREL